MLYAKIVTISIVLINKEFMYLCMYVYCIWDMVWFYFLCVQNFL